MESLYLNLASYGLNEGILFLCMYVCMHVCMYVCMYVCSYFGIEEVQVRFRRLLQLHIMYKQNFISTFSRQTYLHIIHLCLAESDIRKLYIYIYTKRSDRVDSSKISTDLPVWPLRLSLMHFIIHLSNFGYLRMIYRFFYISSTIN